MTRREVLKIACLFSAGGVLWSIPKNTEAKFFLRPPGAKDEKSFVASCIKCGLCVGACPYDTLKLSTIFDNTSISTPYYSPRKIPCYMCEDIPCAAICPTSALDIKSLQKDGLLDVNLMRSGVAVVDMKSCVAYFGIQCDACYRACPLIDKALYLEYKRNDRTAKHAFLLPVVDGDICTGCGMCEKVCITKKPAISVVRREFVLGKMNDNYVIGWEKGGDKKLKDADTKIKLDKTKALDYLNSEEF